MCMYFPFICDGARSRLPDLSGTLGLRPNTWCDGPTNPPKKAPSTSTKHAHPFEFVLGRDVNSKILSLCYYFHMPAAIHLEEHIALHIWTRFYFTFMQKMRRKDGTSQCHASNLKRCRHVCVAHTPILWCGLNADANYIYRRLHPLKACFFDESLSLLIVLYFNHFSVLKFVLVNHQLWFEFT